MEINRRQYFRSGPRINLLVLGGRNPESTIRRKTVRMNWGRTRASGAHQSLVQTEMYLEAPPAVWLTALWSHNVLIHTGTQVTGVMVIWWIADTNRFYSSDTHSFAQNHKVHALWDTAAWRITCFVHGTLTIQLPVQNLAIASKAVCVETRHKYQAGLLSSTQRQTRGRQRLLQNSTFRSFAWWLE